MALERFQVRIGHLKVFVEANSSQQAVDNARSLFCRELPRLWDVITELDASRFEVLPIVGSAKG